MKVSEGRIGRVFVVRLEDGDVVPECIEKFAEDKGISVGQVVLVGGIGSGEVVVGPRRSDEMPPEPLDAAIIFAPVGELLPLSLKTVDKGGIIVCAGIYMSDIPSFGYSLLWEERVVRSVANLMRKDGEELMRIAPKVPVKTEVTTFPLFQANEAMDSLRKGEINGAAVLTMIES